MSDLETTANRKLTGSTAPEPPNPADGTAKRCARCGTDNPPDRHQCARCGRWLKGNGAALTHGLSRYRDRGALPADLRISVDEFRDALVADQGGLIELTAVRAGLCRLLVDMEVGRRLLMGEIVRKGVDSKPGRAAYDRLLGTVDRWQRVAMTLGLARKAHRVPTLDEVMDGDGE